MKDRGIGKNSYGCSFCGYEEHLTDNCFRHSLCHGDRLSFGLREREGGFDPVKAGGEGDLSEGNTTENM